MSCSHHAASAVKPTTAVSYVRSRSNTGASTIAAQHTAIQAYAHTHGIEIIQEYCDGEDETDDPEPRPAYHRLLHDLELSPGSFSTILIMDWTCWSRSIELHEMHSVEIQLRRAGVTLTAVTPLPVPVEISDALLAQHLSVTPAVIYLPPLGSVNHDSVSEAIIAYASQHGMSIHRMYRDDDGTAHYPALQQLLTDITVVTRDFTAVLLPDTSWWTGMKRFPDFHTLAEACQQQDVDMHPIRPPASESAYLTTIIHAIKHAMAAEYVRELSTRVLANAKLLSHQGKYLGGKPGYGYRRMLVDQDGTHIGLLEDGAQKILASQHVTLAPGPEHEIALVNWMYQQIADDGLTVAQLVQCLAARGAVTDQGRAWTRATVLTALTSPRYIGTLVYNKTNTQLGSRRRLNGTEDIIIVPNAFPGIVPRTLYDRVQAMLAKQQGRAR